MLFGHANASGRSAGASVLPASKLCNASGITGMAVRGGDRVTIDPRIGDRLVGIKSSEGVAGRSFGTLYGCEPLNETASLNLE